MKDAPNSQIAKPEEETRFRKFLGQRLRELRRAQGLTLKDVEARGRLAWRHLQKIEAGKNCTIITPHRISQIYGVSLSEIFRGL